VEEEHAAFSGVFGCNAVYHSSCRESWVCRWGFNTHVIIAIKVNAEPMFSSSYKVRWTCLGTAPLPTSQLHMHK